jgi:hypothetical protein
LIQSHIFNQEIQVSESIKFKGKKYITLIMSSQQANNKTSRLISLLFIGSAIIIIASEFLPWVSGYYTPLDLYIENIGSATRFVLFFPIVAGVVILGIGVALLVKPNLPKGYLSLILIFAVGLIVAFLFEMFSDSGLYIFNTEGIYYGMTGYGLTFFGLLLMLIEESPITPEPALPVEK